MIYQKCRKGFNVDCYYSVMERKMQKLITKIQMILKPMVPDKSTLKILSF
ncbi:hypothetical protein [Enterococcus sp. BWT-B8]|nr:hypothetical protein [Enterococcus sp. BWT-B8]